MAGIDHETTTTFMQESPTANSPSTTPPAQLMQRSASDGVGINRSQLHQSSLEDANRQCTSDVVWRKRFNNKVSPTRHIIRKGQPQPVVANSSSSSGTTGSDVANRSSPSAIVIQDVEVVDGLFPTHQRPQSRSSMYIMELQELPSLKQSCKPLKKRLKLRRQALEYHGDDSQQTARTRAAKRIWCETLRFVKWPKWRSEIRNKFSFRLWKGQINHVESHFGSFVASYFVFLRWLLYMNIIITLLWCGFTCIPMLVLYGYQGLDPVNKAAACVYPKPENSDSIRCSSNTSYTDPVLVYEIKNSHIYDCIDDFFNIRECSIDNDGVAYKEGSSEITVSAVKIYSNCTQNFGSSSLATYVLCSQVKSRFEWYEYILDFVTGAGFFNETLLFHGGYPPARSSHFVYRFDLAFLFIVGIVYVYSIIHLVYKMGKTYNESYTGLIKGGSMNFSNRLFSSWDFNINDTKASNRRKANIKTDFQEEHGDAQARERKTTWKKYLLVILIRILSNAVVIVLLVIAGAAIYYSADTEFDLLTKPTVRDNIILSTLVGFITSTVISVLNIVYPWLFYFIAILELYPTESRRVSWTLVRTIFVRLSSLLVLLGSLYRVISNCTTAVDESISGDSCTLNKITHTILTNTTNDTQIDCPVCWETYIGQQFYKLALFNFVFALGATASSETARNVLFHLVKRIRNENYRIKMSKIPIFQRGHFDIPRSILDLIYTQTLLWLGFLFSPWIPLIILPTTFLLFYVKKISLMFNLDPDRKSLSKSSRSNFIFLILMLISLFFSIIPVLFAVTQLKPSESCGPFRGLNTMYDSTTNLVETWPCGVQVAVDFLTSAAFVVPLITIFLLALYGMWVALKTQKQKYKFMKKSILAANANGTADMADVFGNLGIMRRHYTRRNLQIQHTS